MNNDVTKTEQPGSVTSCERTRGGCFFRPNVDILETEEELLLYADMPGTSAEQVTLDYDNGSLSIHAEVSERQGENAQYVLREYGIGDFHREFQVNEDIDASQISASYQDGVLTVRLPKSEAVKPKRIEVKAH